MLYNKTKTLIKEFEDSWKRLRNSLEIDLESEKQPALIKVKIVKCSSVLAWYSERAGEIFEVELMRVHNQVVFVVVNTSTCLFIQVEDCEIYKEKKR